MVASPLIVCERTGKWALAWRKSLRAVSGAAGVHVIETRSLAECRQALTETPAAGVSLELRADNAESTCEMLTHWNDEFPAALAIVTADRGLEQAEELVREAGAAWFVTSTRQLPALASVVCRHVARQPQPVSRGHERIWEQLPWAEPANSTSSGRDEALPR